MKAFIYLLEKESLLFHPKQWSACLNKQPLSDNSIKPSVNSFILSVKRKKTLVKTFSASVNGFFLSVKRKKTSVKTFTASVNSFILSVKRKISTVKEKHTALPIQISWMQL